MSTAWKTIRIFISSTFKDMQAERDHLVRFVFPKLREELVKWRVHIEDVDLRWGVTSDQDAFDLCMKEINLCHPRFICMLGWRYGWVPPPKEIPAEFFVKVRDGKSDAGTLEVAEKEALTSIYRTEAVNGNFQLKPKPKTTDELKAYRAHCELAVSVLQRAGQEDAKRSITASEIHHGALEQLDTPAFRTFYFRQGNPTGNIPGTYIETSGTPAVAYLEDLKAQIKNPATKGKVIVSPGLEELRPLVCHEYPWDWDDPGQRITRLEKFGELVHADIIASVKAEFGYIPEDKPAVTDEEIFEEEAQQMEAFIEERTRIGRYVASSRDKLLVPKLEAFVADDGAPNILVLTGAPGSGKSAFLAKFRRELAVLYPYSFILPHFVGVSAGSTDLRRTLRRLCHKLDPKEPPPQDINELKVHFQKVLIETAKKQRIILILDAINQFDATDGAHWMNWLPSTLPPNVRILASVITSPEGQSEHQSLATLRQRHAQIEPLEPLENDDSRAILTGFLDRYSKHLTEAQIAAILRKPEGNLPLYLLVILEELRTLGTDEQLTALSTSKIPPEELKRLREDDHDKILEIFIEKELPDTALELFKWILVKRLPHDQFLSNDPIEAANLVGKFAACLGVSRHGLSELELAAILAPDPEGNHDKQGTVAALLRLLRPYLMYRGDLLDFYHGQFREAARETSLKTGVQRLSAHTQLASYFRDQADPEGNQSWKGVRLRGFDELPYQLASSHSQRQLVLLLTDAAFASAKAAKGAIFDLLNDYNVAASRAQRHDTGSPRLLQLKQIVRREAERLSRYPECSLQQILLGIAALASPDSGLRSQAEILTKTHQGSDTLKVWSLVPEHRVQLVTQAPARGDLTVENLCATQTGVLLRYKGGTWTEYSKDFQKIRGGSTPAAYCSRIAAGGEVIAFASAGTAMVWNPWPTAAPKFWQLGEPISVIVCSANGCLLAIGGSGGSFLIRDLRNLEASPLLSGTLEGPIKAVWFSTEESVTIVTGSGVLAHASCNSEWKFSKQFTTDQDCRLACSAGRDAACLAGEDNLLQCFDSEGGLKWRSTLPAKPHSLAFFAGDNRNVVSILAGLEDGMLQEINAQNGVPVQLSKVSERTLQFVEWHPAAAAVLCSDSTGSVFFVSRSCPDEIEFRAWPATQRILSVHWNELDQCLETLTPEGERLLIQKGTGEAGGDWQVSALHAIDGPLDDAWILPDGLIVAQHRVSDESQIWLHRSVGRERIRSRRIWKGNSFLNMGGPCYIHSMAVSRCGTHYVAASMFLGENRAAFRQGKLSRFTFGQKWNSREGFIDEIVLSDLGEVIVTTQARGNSNNQLPARIISCRGQNHVLLDDGWGGGIAGVERGSARALFGTAISRNGSTIAAIDTNRALWLFSFDPNRPKIPPRGSPLLEGVVSCCLSDSGTLSAALRTDQAISIFQIKDGDHLKPLAVILPSGKPSCFQFSPCGRHLIIAGQDFIQAVSFSVVKTKTKNYNKTQHDK